MKNETILKTIAYNQSYISKISETYDLIGFYVFSISEKESHINATTRMFAPFYGIAEEAATGMASGPLACYFYRYVDKKNSYMFKQGQYMHQPSPSLLKVKLDTKNHQIQKLFAGGSAYIKKEIEVQL